MYIAPSIKTNFLNSIEEKGYLFYFVPLFPHEMCVRVREFI